MRLRVAAARRLVLDGQERSEGEEFDVPGDAAPTWLQTGLVVPADGVWPDGLYVTSGLPQAPPLQEPADMPAQASPDPPGDAEDAPACGACEPPTSQRGKALAVCSTPRCPCLTVSGRCPGCTRAARQKRGAAWQRGYDASWTRTRRAYLREHPYCECDECADLPMPLRPTATEVDHMDGLGPLGPRGHDWTNLRAMTKAHHSRATAINQPGGWNDRH